ncbi:L-arabinose transport system permease protein AraH [Baekduia alba]|uniref:ABC transporter permease n=1 Tax=Baekduia alba TaxID=2997333 RepID=UPI002340F993|nr:ABC transporter permease [Baekduia alba]WCB92281.1 L-arabinose transport system permease protein AraH [Baekduia alba]
MSDRATSGRWSDLAPTAALLAVLVVGLALFAPGFLTSGNVANLGRNASILGLAACGQAVVIITRGLDLSSGSVVALMSVVVIKELDHGPTVAFALAILVALAVGVVNGVLIGLLSVPAFLVTLGMLTGLHGLASYIVGGVSVQAPTGVDVTWASNAQVGFVPVPVVLALAGLALLSLLLRRTTAGRCWYLIGANPEAGRQAGLRVGRLILMAYVVAAGFVAVAGVILAARVQSGQPNLQPTLPFEAIAACAIGGLSMSGGAGRVAGVLTGVLIVSVTENGLVLLNVSDDAQTIVVGVVTVASVILAGRGLPLGRLRLRRARPAPAGSFAGTERGLAS